MISFKEFQITENYKNFIGPDSHEKRVKWADQVWGMIQSSYAPIGGIKGSGFSSKQDMIDNIPFWKIYTKGERAIAAVFYKDSGGRKMVALATDGSELGKKIINDIFKASLGVSYGEKSGPALATMVKAVPWETLKNFIILPEKIEKITGKKVIKIKDFDLKKLPQKDQFAYEKFTQLRPFFYVRDLGGEMRMKVAIGTPQLKIF